MFWDHTLEIDGLVLGTAVGQHWDINASIALARDVEVILRHREIEREFLCTLSFSSSVNYPRAAMLWPTIF